MSRSVALIIVLDLPIFAVAAMTRTMVQAFATLLGVWAAVAIGIAIGFLPRGGAPPAVAASGLQWMTPAFWLLLAFAAAFGIILAQYRHRATRRARTILWGAAGVAPLVSLSAWGFVFSAQRWLSADPSSAQPIAIAFDSGQGRATAMDAPASFGTVLLPIRVEGVAPASFVMNDRTMIRLVGQDGAILYTGRSTATVGYGDDFPVGSKAGGRVRVHQRINFPTKVYERVQSRSIRMEIDYSLTLFRADSAETLPALNGAGIFSKIGRCRTQLDSDGDDIALGCTESGAAPSCVTVALVNPHTGKRNPEATYCTPDYAPVKVHLLPDAMSHFSADVKFNDFQHLARYPVDGSQLGASRVELSSYAPAAHFSRHVVIPDIRLQDWAAE